MANAWLTTAIGALPPAPWMPLLIVFSSSGLTSTHVAWIGPAGIVCACVESGPVQQQVLVKLEVIRPLFILEKLLAHEQHRDAGRG